MKGTIKLELICDCGHAWDHRLDNKDKNQNIYFVCPRCSKMGTFIFWWAASSTGKIEDYAPQQVISKEKLEALENFKLHYTRKSHNSLIGP